MKSKKIEKTIKSCIAMAVMLLAGGFVGYLAGAHMHLSGKGELYFFAMLLLLYVSLLLQIIFYEGGHLVFGLLTGYGFSSFRIGSLMLLKNKKGLHFKLLKLAGTGGQCLMTAPEPKDGMIPVVLYNLGGPLMNFITAGLALLLRAAFPMPDLLSDFFLELGGIGLALGLFNGIPLHAGGIDNDGMNAISMTRSPVSNRAFQIQLNINAGTAEGIRLKDMPEAWFTLPAEEDMKNPMIAALAVFAENRLMDEHKFPEAKALCDRLLEMESGMVGIYRNLITCDRIYLELMGEGDPAVLKSMLSKPLLQFIKSMKNFPTVLRTRYAIALLKDREEDVAETLSLQFEKVAKRYPSESDVQSERKLMDLAKAEYDRRIQ